jgi:hypothetical protein
MDLLPEGATMLGDGNAGALVTRTGNISLLMNLSNSMAPVDGASATKAPMKSFKTQSGIGKARHVVSFHDGRKRHRDGSPFFDIRILKNKPQVADFVHVLKKQGYCEI